MAVEKTGLVAVFETEQFRKGVDTYLKGLSAVGGATSKAGTTAQKGAAGIANFGSVAAGAVAGATALATAGATLVVGAFTGIISKATEATGAVLEFGKAALFTAGRVDQLNRVALLLGERAGFAQSETQGFIDDLTDQGIRADAASKLIASLARNQLDLAQATELATIAGNAAILTDRDTTDTLESLNQAILTNQIDVARTAGVNVNFTKAQDELAQSLGTTRDQLTENEKIQANYNAVLAEGDAIAGLYAISQESPTKALRSLNRQIFNLQSDIGSAFLPAWKSLIDISRAAVSAFSEMIGEGGALRPILINLGAAASLMADGIKRGAMVVIEAFKRLRIDASGNVGQFIEDAFTWGVELMANFAEGIVKGASAALTAAMNAVQNMLGFWLAPGSPPKVAPNIDKWGASAFTQYLKGFSDADFGVLKGLQGVLGKILNKPELQAITLDIGTAIGEGGPDEAFFSKLGAAAGDFGDEVTQLARNYFELADAQTDAEMAQSQLNDAMKAMSEAEITVNNLTRQYNDLLRAGASDKVLEAQLAQIKAGEEQLTLASEQKVQAEENIKTTEERLKALAEETGLQEELVNQLLALAAEEEKAAGAGAPGERPETGAAAGGIVRDAGGLGEGIGDALGGGITTGIQDAIENAKKLLLEKLGRIFAPLKKRWEESIKPTLNALKERFVEFREFVILAWEEMKERIQPIIDTFIDWWEVKIPDALDEIKRVIDTVLMPAFRAVWGFVKDNLIPKLRELAEDIFGKLETAIKNIKEFLTGENGLVAAFATLRTFIVDKLINTFNTFRTQYVQPLVDAFQRLFNKLDAVNRIAQIIKQTIEWILGQNIDDPFSGGSSFGEDSTGGLPGKKGVDITPIIINVPAGATAGASSTTTNNFDFGNNNISDQMDVAALQALIIQTIREELG